MSLEPVETSTTSCPKCGFASQNREICDACGVVFSKLRAKEVEVEAFGGAEEARKAYSLYNAPAGPSHFWSRSVLVLAVVAVIGALYHSTNVPVYVRDILIELPDQKEPTGEEQGFLVEFWAPWCGPCKMFSPILDQIEQEYGDKLRMIRVNTEDNPKLSKRMGIEAIPTVMLFNKEGRLKKRLTGARPKSAMENEISRVLLLDSPKTDEAPSSNGGSPAPATR